MTKETNEQLVARYQAGDESALAALLNQNVGMIFKISSKFVSTDFDLDDAQQEARIAVMHAARLFDHTKGFKFSTYCWRSIKCNLLNWKGDDELIRIGRSRLSQGCEPCKVISVDAEMSPEDSSQWNAIADQSAVRPDAIISEREELFKLRSLAASRLNRLDNRSRQIVRSKFLDEKTFEEIAVDHGVSKQRASQIFEKAMEKLSVADSRCKACGSSHFVKHGRDRNGTQRWRCAACGRTTRKCQMRDKPITRFQEEKIALFISHISGSHGTLRGGCRAAGINKNLGRKLLDHFGIARKCRTCSSPITGNRFWFCSDACQRWRKRSDKTLSEPKKEISCAL